MSKRAALILAGGSGTRLWPLSTEERPKQFIPLFGERSLLQQTFDRLTAVIPAAQIHVSTSIAYVDLVADQLPLMPRENILPEPLKRSTAPAIAACCAELAHRGFTSTGVFHSDHAIADAAVFATTVLKGFEFAERNGLLVTIGIRPTAPNTGYGYLEMGNEIEQGVLEVLRFIEKPDALRAEELVASGRFAWNGGMFIWTLESLGDALREHAPEIAALAGEIVASDEGSCDELYSRMPAISIDYAVMEKTSNLAAIWGDFGWSDVGSWSAVAALTGSAAGGSVILEESSNVFVRSHSGKTIAVVGLEDIAVIDSPDGLLIVRLEHAELVAKVVNKLTK